MAFVYSRCMGDYWVIGLDEGYQLVAVSEPFRKYLCVLSRTPKVDQKSYEEFLGRLVAKGFNVNQLEATKQED